MEQGQKIKRSVNRQYKDSLFRMIFSEKEELLSLYNAVNGTQYSDTNDLTINTIEDVIFLGYKNDLSLVLEQRLGIYEHQSTWCGNIPLRNLIYIENDVLKDFLLKHREEVETVSLGEYNFQEHMEIVAKESREDALAEGISIGEKRGIERGIEIQRIESEKLLSLEREESHKRLEKERKENLKRIIAKFLKIGMSKEEIIEELKDGFDIEFIKRAMEDIS